MRVTLLENVASLGATGETVEVPEGYATHFLFPQHLAVVETGKPESTAPVKAPSKAEREEERLAEALDGLDVVIPAKGVQGKPKAPVTVIDIRKGLKALGYTVEKSAVHTEPIQTFGTTDVPVEFPSGFEAMIRVTVEPT